MSRALQLLAPCILAVFVAGCGVFLKSDLGDGLDEWDVSQSRAWLVTLDPGVTTESIRGPGLPYFGVWGLVGQAELSQTETREVLAALSSGLRWGPSGTAACFFPHHGLRLAGPRGIAELDICFHCSQVYARGAGLASGGSIAESRVEPVFDRLVETYHLRMVRR